MNASETVSSRVVAFFDGQNLFHAARHAFGYTYPNYNPSALAQRICTNHGWQLTQTRFYTGVPDKRDNAFWNRFWTAKLGTLGHHGVHVFSRPLRYRYKRVTLPNGESHRILVGEEKGIDVRIALDIVSLAFHRQYDVALVFSQDQDLSEAADDVRLIARDQSRWIKLASAFPVSSTTRNRRGIDKTDWIKIDRAHYDRCLDPRDYRSTISTAA